MSCRRPGQVMRMCVRIDKTPKDSERSILTFSNSGGPGVSVAVCVQNGRPAEFGGIAPRMGTDRRLPDGSPAKPRAMVTREAATPTSRRVRVRPIMWEFLTFLNPIVLRDRELRLTRQVN